MLCDSTARWAGVLFVSWAGIHYKREIIDDWMCPPTMFWTHWRNRNCAKTSRLKMLISVFHLTREIVPTTEHRWNCLTKTWLAKFRNSSSKNSNLHVIYDKTYRKNFWFLNFFNESKRINSSKEQGIRHGIHQSARRWYTRQMATCGFRPSFYGR